MLRIEARLGCRVLKPKRPDRRRGGWFPPPEDGSPTIAPTIGRRTCPDKKAPTAKNTTSRKSAKPRTIKVVGEVNDDEGRQRHGGRLV